MRTEERLDVIDERIRSLFSRIREDHEWTMAMLVSLRKRVEALELREGMEMDGPRLYPIERDA